MTHFSVVDDYHKALIEESAAQIFPAWVGFSCVRDDPAEPEGPTTKVVKGRPKNTPKAAEVAETKAVAGESEAEA